MTSDALGLIGLAQRAGRCVSGAELCEKAIREGGARLLLIDSEASEATAERFRSLAGTMGIRTLTIPGVGRAIGREDRRVCAVMDKGFADAIYDKGNLNKPGGVVKE